MKDWLENLSRDQDIYTQLGLGIVTGLILCTAAIMAATGSNKILTGIVFFVGIVLGVLTTVNDVRVTRKNNRG